MGPFSMVWPGMISKVKVLTVDQGLWHVGQQYFFNLVGVARQCKTVGHVGKAVSLIENRNRELVNG